MHREREVPYPYPLPSRPRGGLNLGPGIWVLPACSPSPHRPHSNQPLSRQVDDGGPQDPPAPFTHTPTNLSPVRSTTADPKIGDHWAIFYRFELQFGTPEYQAAVIKGCTEVGSVGGMSVILM